MNEEELKTIWRRQEAISPKIDMEYIRQSAFDTQKSLQRKIKWDIAINILFYVAVIPLAFYDPFILVLMPFAGVIWIWYLWEMRRLYKYDSEAQKFENVKSFLLGKQKLVNDYLRRTRYITYFGTPLIYTTAFLCTMSFSELWASRTAFFAFLVINEIMMVVVVNYYIKKVYAPVLEELEYLLEQFNGDAQ